MVGLVIRLSDGHAIADGGRCDDDGLIDDGECREMAGRTWRKLPRGRGPNTDLSIGLERYCTSPG